MYILENEAVTNDLIIGITSHLLEVSDCIMTESILVFVMGRFSFRSLRVLFDPHSSELLTAMNKKARRVAAGWALKMDYSVISEQQIT